MALILVVIALLKQLILLVGFLLTAIKIAIVVVFVALLVMIVLAISATARASVAKPRSKIGPISPIGPIFRFVLFSLHLPYISRQSCNNLPPVIGSGPCRTGRMDFTSEGP